MQQAESAAVSLASPNKNGKLERGTLRKLDPARSAVCISCLLDNK